MTIFNINDMKDDFVDSLKSRLSPENTFGTVEYHLNASTLWEVGQSFYPFSTAWREDTWRSFPVDINVKKTGTPTGSIEVYLCSNTDDVPGSTICGRTLSPSSIDTSYGDVRFWMDLTSGGQAPLLGSYTRYWLKICTGQTVDASNYYSIQRDSVNTHYWSGEGMYSESGSVSWNTLNADIRFKVSLPTWIYPDYPHVALGLDKYPRIAVDLASRGEVEQKWIDYRLSDYNLNIIVVLYSRYPREMGELMSLVDRALWQDRISIPTFRIITPSVISNAVIPKAGLVSRSMLFTGKHREQSANE